MAKRPEMMNTKPIKQNRAPRKRALLDAIAIADGRAMRAARQLSLCHPSDELARAKHHAAMFEAEHIANALRRLLGLEPRYPASLQFVPRVVEEEKAA